jgi:hypothetical protein
LLGRTSVFGLFTLIVAECSFFFKTYVALKELNLKIIFWGENLRTVIIITGTGTGISSN